MKAVEQSRLTGLAMHREIAAYRDRTGMTQAVFSRAVGLSEQTISNFRHVLYPTARTVAVVCAFMERHPAGMAEQDIPARVAVPVQGTGGAFAVACARVASIDPARPGVTAAEALASDRAPSPRRAARATPAGAVTPRTAAEAIQAALVAEPGDLVALIKVKWPVMWCRIVAQARAAGRMPGSVLFEAIERGLEESA